MDPRRLYSALGFIPLLYVGIRYSPPWLFSLLMSTIAFFGLWEFLSLYFSGTRSITIKVLSCLMAALLLGAMHIGFSQIWLVMLLGIVALIMANFFISPANTKRRLPNWAAYIFGVLYVGLLLGHYALLRNLEHGVVAGTASDLALGEEDDWLVFVAAIGCAGRRAVESRR